MSIIKNNNEIYMALCQRKKELSLSNKDISFEAISYGIVIPVPSLSKYFARKDEYSLSEKAVIFLCDRYCIDIVVSIRKEEYSEFDAKVKLKIKYPIELKK